MQRPPLTINVTNLEHRLIIDVDEPEALSRWCLELALMLCGLSSSFTAVSPREWEGTVWFGLQPGVEDGLRIRQEGSNLLLSVDKDLLDELLRVSVERYRTGRGWNEVDWGLLTVKLTGPAWQKSPDPTAHVAKRSKR